MADNIGWGVMNGSHSVSHFFASDKHPKMPLYESLCGRHKSNDMEGLDIFLTDHHKHCGDCERLLKERPDDG